MPRAARPSSAARSRTAGRSGLARSRLVRLPALASLIGVLALLAATVPAQAQAQSYRYWGYYTLAGETWAFAQTGPAEAVPADGSVEGWRFAITGEASSRVPRALPTVDELCAGAGEVPEGNKTVGVVIDYGTAEDAPDGEVPPAARGACAVVPADATGADVLAAVAELRVGDGGFVCGIDGYPTSGCGDQVDAEAPSGEEQPVSLALPEQSGGEDGSADTGGSTWLPAVLGLVAVGALGAAAVLLSRRRRAGEPGEPDGPGPTT